MSKPNRCTCGYRRRGKLHDQGEHHKRGRQK
jgi:hypothetical protein